MTKDITAYEDYKELVTKDPYKTCRRVWDRCRMLRATKNVCVLEMGGHINFMRKYKGYDILSITQTEFLDSIGIKSKSTADHYVMMNKMWQQVVKRTGFPWAKFLAIEWTKLEVMKQAILASTTNDKALELLEHTDTHSKRALLDEKLDRTRVWGKAYLETNADGTIKSFKLKEVHSNTAGWWEVMGGKTVRFNFSYREHKEGK